MVGADFMATAIFIVAKFKSVQCRSAGQRLALILGSAPASKRIFFTDSHGKERIEPQKIMIVEILVACGHAQQTLGDQFAHGVFDKERITRIVKAAGQGPRDAQALIEVKNSSHPLQRSAGPALCLFSLALGGRNRPASRRRGPVGIAGSRRITPGTKTVTSAPSHSKCKPRGPDSCAARSKTDCQKQTAPQSQRK